VRALTGAALDTFDLPLWTDGNDRVRAHVLAFPTSRVNIVARTQLLHDSDSIHHKKLFPQVEKKVEAGCCNSAKISGANQAGEFTLAEAK
jgi:hypothetical protein